MSENKNVKGPPHGGQSGISDSTIAISSSEVSSAAGSVKTGKTQSRVSSSSERQIKFERAQKCLENAALVSKRIKEHRKATAELLGRPFEDDDGGDNASEMGSTMSERTGYSVTTDTSTTLSVQDALNIPGISESLANTLKQKELLMERIKQYKEISKRPMKTTAVSKKDSTKDSSLSISKGIDSTNAKQLASVIKEKENALSLMQVKMKAMETTIMELQEKISEKDQLLEAKNKATSLMSDSLSKKEKDSLHLLEDTKEQMIKMQENFVKMETEWKEEKERLLQQIQEKDEKINSLQEANTILENSRFEISVAHAQLAEELENKNKIIAELQDSIQKLSQGAKEIISKESEYVQEEKGSLEISNMVELTKKVELLEQLNCQMRQTNKELEIKLATTNEPKTPEKGSPSKKGSPLPSRKGSRNTASKIKSPWSQLSTEPASPDSEKKPNVKLEMLVQSLNKEILDKEYAIKQKDTVIAELESLIKDYSNTINDLKYQLKSDVTRVDIGICTESYETEVAKSKGEKQIHFESLEGGIVHTDTNELEEKLRVAQEQIEALNKEIDSANKNMIKVKSNHKLKLKQMQKTIDNFSKVSDANAEIVKLNEEIHQLSQKVAELEEEKGNLQLHLVDYDSGRLTESDVFKKMIEMENLAEARLKAISVLESQKFDLVQELHELKQKYVEMEDKLADITQLQSDQVCSEMKSVQLEEQIDQLTAAKKELELVIDNLKLDKEYLDGKIEVLNEEKDDLLHKLEHYIQENMELTDKLEKLSAEKVSSAESIEIVESLTTQEKLELEEYNKGIVDSKTEEPLSPTPKKLDENIEKLKEQSVDLNRKIDLFTQERQEVMGKMAKISYDNESLQSKIIDLTNECRNLQNNIELLSREKQDLLVLNEELSHQIEELKRERIDIMKESVETSKPSSIEDVGEVVASDILQDDKTSGEKGNNRTKNVKQLTKEILKLKNVIKEREAEIGDCQMKILSLEEQQQKQKELVQSIASYETKIKILSEENYKIKEELEKYFNIKESDISLQQSNEFLQQEIQKLHDEYTNTINMRDGRIKELEMLLVEYEKQVFNYGNILQQKDKELTEYVNQISKLNDVSQKLKSTIELLEEEKANDQNSEIIKSLNKQVSAYQKKLSDHEEKIRILEEEKSQLTSLKGTLENKTHNLDTELKKLHESLTEKQNIIKELQTQQQIHAEELSFVKIQVKERDEEIHEIKLQLRKESIENEKLRVTLTEKYGGDEKFKQEIDATQDKLQKLTIENQQLSEKYEAIETKNKELMEKMKKYAVTVKKKASLYTELEHQLLDTQKQLEAKNEQIEQLNIQIETLPVIQDKLKFAEEESTRIQSQKVTLQEQNSNQIQQLHSEIRALQEKLTYANNETTQNEILQQENVALRTQIETLNNKLADYEVEQKNSMNLVTKISSLEADINQRQIHVVELLSKIENQEQQFNQLQFGYDAKLQERDVYIESLETEITKYKNRIGRLEESISVMEDSRYSLERKADQLDTQLQEKQKAYSEYTSQEDQLVSRLAALMDHDRVVEKQLCEIERENKELQHKLHFANEENLRLRKSLSDIQEYCNTLVEKASKADSAESDVSKYVSQLHELDAQLKRTTHEYQLLTTQRKQDIEELESEFNTQIENSIKEKKILSERYEKLIEHVTQLENKLQEYRNNIENLKSNIEELTRENQDLVYKSNSKQMTQTPDYTEQYINEINKLNSIVNSKDQEIYELNNKIHSLQMNNVSVVSNLESKIKDFHIQIQQSTTKIDELIQENNKLQQHNNEVKLMLQQKENEIKQIYERKKVTFEMNIPKTEGMIISSTIEPLSEGQIEKVEAQILTDPLPIGYQQVTQEHKQQTALSVEGVIEEKIVPKKAYLCYKGEKDVEPSNDPFNSDEGWGFGESEEIAEVTPDLTYLTQQVDQLKSQNELLKADIEASNTKLIKALKKLKELKNNNEMLSKELKISKQISQSQPSFFDSTIEDELKINIQELEKKIEELTTNLNKEKHEKESLKKQNEILLNANDKLTEMKERLDNEIELWKFKFKEANDKVSTLQWEADSPAHKVTTRKESNTALDEEINKLERENDELQAAVDQLTSQNKELSVYQNQLQSEINILNTKLQQIKSSDENNESVKQKLFVMENNNTELSNANENLKELCQNLEARITEVTHQYEETKRDKEKILNELQMKEKTLKENTEKYETELQCFRAKILESSEEIIHLKSELANSRSQLLWHEERQKSSDSQGQDNLVPSEKLSALEEYCSQLKQSLDDSNNIVTQLRVDNEDLLKKTNTYEEQINELNSKIRHLNTENDQLLSTVAELRSSVASAVDQRGFEIAEIWKQHLAQREADFQKLEHELRTQISASEAKYEQLLDSVQSSTQEETNTLVMVEQVTSLQNKLQDKEEHLLNLQNKYADVINQLDMLRSEMEDERLIFENKLLGQQEEYEKQIKEISLKHQQQFESYEKVQQDFQDEIKKNKTINDKLNQQNEDLTNQLNEKERTVVDAMNQFRLKENEIYKKTHDLTITLNQRNEEFENARKQLMEYEKKLEELNYDKESELAVLRLKIHEKSDNFEKTRKELEMENLSLTEALNAKIIECTNLNRHVSELNRTIEEHIANIAEMQSALENQEMEIVALKEEVNELKISLRLSSSKIEKHVTFSSDTKPGTDGSEQSEADLNKELLDAVPRAELDLALYMLHQRDVRCEELTMELSQLLEERDTLQLRLSDSLRSYEELKSNCKAAGLDVSMGSQDSLSELPSFSVEREQQFVDTHRGQTSRSSSISDPDMDKPKLQAKLSELRSVKHSRDVRFRNESEQRELDLRLLQRDVANLPPEALEQLAQAHHTLSRDSQSTSTVLLNWIRGKSTPKVVHM